MAGQHVFWRWARGWVVAFMPAAVVLGIAVGRPCAGEEPSPKPAPPDRAALQAALDKVAVAYRGRYLAARTVARKTELAREMIDAAGKETDLARRFALLRAARVVAAGAGDLKTALLAVDEMDRHFALDALAMKVDAVHEAGDGNQVDVADVTKLVLPLMDEAVAGNRLGHASRLAEIVRATAANMSDERPAIDEAIVRFELFRRARAAAELNKANQESPQTRELQIPINPFNRAPGKIDRIDRASDSLPRADLLAMPGYPGNPLAGRGKGKGQLVAAGGGNAASEKAVALALRWLAEHQMSDGGWNFNHADCPKCRGQCRNPGTETTARNAATAMALLAYLGAGQTHKVGKYKFNVKGGLYFLVSHMKDGPKGGSLIDGGRGTMYSHGIASIALCEAYAMTHDKGLYSPAQKAVDFIVYAQDPVSGGWRYQPQQKGDTSVFGWQLAALKAGHAAYLRVPPATIKRAYQFLDSVQSDGGAKYGYVDPGAGPATTAIGLLSRMHLGWKKDNPALVRGVKWLSEQGPSKGNMYYDYYATQVLRHWEGEEWVKWNHVMRDHLVDSQAQEGHEQGSWHFKRGGHGADIGGRLYCTTLATLVLEVYYRHLPIYRPPPEPEFPQDKPAEKPKAD